MDNKKSSTYNEKKNKYTQKYIHDNYKQLSIRLTPEEKKIIEQKAAAAGKSVNQYLKDLALDSNPTD